MNFRIVLMDYLRRRDRGWILSLFAVVCLVYLPFIGNPFIFDDLNVIRADGLDQLAHNGFQLAPRWLPFASLAWTYVLFSDVFPHVYHVGNLLLHGATVIVLFYLLRQLMLAAIPECKDSSRMIWGVWLGALVFALHPVAVYAVGYVVQRSILMATLFVLLMQIAYLRGLLTGRWRWLLLAVLAYFLAGLSKEHSLMAPALLAAQSLLLRGRVKASAAAMWLSWGGFAAVGIHIIFMARGVFGVPYEIMASNLFAQQRIVESAAMLHVLSLLTQAGLFFKYLFLWLLPNPAWMSIDMRVPFVSSLGAWQGWLGAAGFVAYGAFALRLLLKRHLSSLLGLAMLYPWLLFIVEFSSIRVQEPFVLYRSYLWMPGAMLLVPLMMMRWPGKKTVIVLLIAATMLLPLAWNRLWIMGDKYRLWNDAVLLLNDENVPGADRIFYNRGTAVSEFKAAGEAIRDLERSVEMSPQLAAIHMALGYEYYKSKRYQDALVQFENVTDLVPANASVYYAKGITYKRLHDDKKFIENMKKSCELKDVVACMIIEKYKKN